MALPGVPTAMDETIWRQSIEIISRSAGVPLLKERYALKNPEFVSWFCWPIAVWLGFNLFCFRTRLRLLGGLLYRMGCAVQGKQNHTGSVAEWVNEPVRTKMKILGYLIRAYLPSPMISVGSSFTILCPHGQTNRDWSGDQPQSQHSVRFSGLSSTSRSDFRKHFTCVLSTIRKSNYLALNGISLESLFMR